jgi:hypothetical protein
MNNPETGNEQMHGFRRNGLYVALAATVLLGGCAADPNAAGNSPASTSISQTIPPVPTTESLPPVQPGWPEAALEASADPGLNALVDYGDILQHRTPDSLMIFTGMPESDPEQINLSAQNMAATLKDYQRIGIEPLVIMEPTINDGNTVLDLNALSQGQYDGVLGDYFKALKNAGVTSAMMGNWIAMPEANTPAWNITDPQVVSQAIIHVAQAQKSVFPDSKVGMLLDSQTYQSGDTDWATGKYKSLVPYTQNMPRGLIDNFGLQGFPWVEEGASASAISKLSPADYLNMNLAIGAADSLGIKNIWYNTGTFKTMYVGTDHAVEASPTDRQRILDDVAQQVMLTRARGYVTWVNVFSTDKSDGEGVDWSYLQDQGNKDVLARFIQHMAAGGIKISLFEAPN